MTLNQLRYFCSASRCHSITKAAQELYVTQPTVSSAIRELEIEFSITLFYRTGNQLVLTQEGAHFYERASELLRSCMEMQAEFSDHARLKSSLRIGIPPMLSTIFFPRLLVAFQEEHPDIAIQLDEYGSVRACDLVQDDNLDLALVNMEMFNLDKFNYHVLTQDQLVYCVTKEHRLAGRSSLDIRDLAEERMLFFNADSVQNQLLNFRFEVIHITPKIVMRSSQIYTTLKFVEQGNCGCFLFESMLHQFPSLIGIPINPPIHTNIGLVWKKGKYISSNMQKFLDFTIRTCSPDSSFRHG